MFEKDDFTHGGFIKPNIRKWILKECLESGDPSNFFWAMRDIIEEIECEEESNLDFWDDVEEEFERMQK